MDEKKTFSKFRLWCTKPTSIRTEVGKLLNPDQTSTKSTFSTDAPKIHENIESCELFKDVAGSQKNFLSLFGLVTSETGQALILKSQKRKKRLCSSPHFLSLLLQAEKQDLDGNVPGEGKSRKRSKNGDNLKKKSFHIVPDGDSKLPLIQNLSDELQDEIHDYHEELCHVCHKDGELLLCDSCAYVYHLSCAGLLEIPRGKWFCKFCQDKLPSDFNKTFGKEDKSFLQYEELQFERQLQLKQAYLLRTEKEKLVCRVKEILEVLEHKHDMEKSYIEKIEQARQMKDEIDLFLMQL